MTGTLDFTSGNVTTASNTLIVSGSVSETSGYVIGNLEEYVGTGSPTVLFPVGTTNNSSNDYTPISVAFSNVGTAGYIIASASSGNPSLSSSDLDTGLAIDVN